MTSRSLGSDADHICLVRNAMRYASLLVFDMEPGGQVALARHVANALRAPASALRLLRPRGARRARCRGRIGQLVVTVGERPPSRASQAPIAARAAAMMSSASLRIAGSRSPSTITRSNGSVPE